MIISDVKNDVSVGGAQSVNAFTIKASAKAFEILSSNLYSNKIGSMIRELSTNAYDAHVMLNKADEPFIITLPNTFDPTFKIRDFGPGLSEREINTIYTTFFESTKTDSNDVVGCLGLGSKSPFGISDSFTINSYYNGVKSIYSAFLNDLRIPSIAKFIDLQTDEPNGIEIEVAVKEPDFSSFSKEVNAQLKYFKTKPIVQGNSSFVWEPAEEYLYEGSNWKMSKYRNISQILQGQIAYPINTNSMGKDYDDAPSAIQLLLERSLIIEVPIGDVNIAPSREALSYDIRTSKNIITAAEKVLEELPVMIKEAINECETEYEAKLKYDAIITHITGGRYKSQSLISYITQTGQILWKNKDVSSLDILIDQKYINYATILSQNFSKRYSKSKYYLNHADQWQLKAMNLDSVLIFIASDKDKMVEARAKQYVADKYPNKKMNLIVINSNFSLKTCAEKLGLKTSQLINVSDLDKIRRRNSIRKVSGSGVSTPTITKIPIDRYKPSSPGYFTRNQVQEVWEKIEVDNVATLKGYYVDIINNKLTLPDGKLLMDAKAFIKGVITLGYITKTDEIYGIRPMHKRYKHTLINLFDHVAKHIVNFPLKPRYNFKNQLFYKINDNLKELTVQKYKLSDTSPFKQLLEFIIESQTNEYSHDISQVLHTMNLYPEIINKFDVMEVISKIYPLLDHVYFGSNIKMIIDYIIQTDRVRDIDKAEPIIIN